MRFEQLMNEMSAKSAQTYRSNIYVTQAEPMWMDVAALRENVTTSARSKFLSEVLFHAAKTAAKRAFSISEEGHWDAIIASLPKDASAILVLAESNARKTFDDRSLDTTFPVFASYGEYQPTFRMRGEAPRKKVHQLRTTELSLGGTLILEDGWLNSRMDEHLDERVGRNYASYSATVTIEGVWSLDPSKITFVEE